MTLVSEADDLGLSLGPLETIKVSVTSLAVVWIQIFVVETNVANLSLGSAQFSFATSMVIDLPLALVVTLTVRYGRIAPWFGFAVGVLVDCYQPGLFGLHAGVFCLGATAGPSVLSLFPGVRTLVTGTALIGFVMLIVRAVSASVLSGHLVHSLLSLTASIAATSVTVVIFAYPFAGLLDRRSRRTHSSLNRSAASAVTSPMRRLRLLMAIEPKQ